MKFESIQLKIILPFKVFAEESDIKKITIETLDGSYGFFPNRLDSVSFILPGIIYYESESKGEVFLAVDEGVFVKEKNNVTISVRNAIGGTDLGNLHKIAEEQFKKISTDEMEFRKTMERLESNFIKQFKQL